MNSPVASMLRSPAVWAGVLLVAAIAGGIYWQAAAAQKREAAELARIADEQREQQRAAELEARRLREQQRFAEEMQAKKDVEEKQRQMEIEFRQNELQRKQFIADERGGPKDSSYAAALANRVQEAEERSRREAEYRQKYEEDHSRRQAQDEVDRQKRYLDQREYDEQAARLRREQSARDAQYVPPAPMPAPAPEAPYPRRPVKPSAAPR